MQFLYRPPSAVLLLCDVSVEIIIPKEDKEYNHVNNHCLESGNLKINLITRDDLHIRAGKDTFATTLG